MDYTVRGILQARILEWVPIPSPGGSSQPRDRTQVSHSGGGFFTDWATGKPIVRAVLAEWTWAGVLSMGTQREWPGEGLWAGGWVGEGKAVWQGWTAKGSARGDAAAVPMVFQQGRWGPCKEPRWIGGLAESSLPSTGTQPARTSASLPCPHSGPKPRVLLHLQESSVGKVLPAVQETRVQSLGGEEPLEKGMAAHSSILAWRLPWTEEPGGLQSMGLQESDTAERLNHQQDTGEAPGSFRHWPCTEPRTCPLSSKADLGFTPTYYFPLAMTSFTVPSVFLPSLSSGHCQPPAWRGQEVPGCPEGVRNTHCASELSKSPSAHGVSMSSSQSAALARPRASPDAHRLSPFWGQVSKIQTSLLTSWPSEPPQAPAPCSYSPCSSGNSVLWFEVTSKEKQSDVW